MKWTVKTPQELSNPEYQELPQVSGSGLSIIHNQSPAHYKYQERETTKALAFGIAAHAIILEKESFDAEFVRGIDPEQYPDALVTQADMKAWLKEKGQKVSGTKPELVDRILSLEPETQVLDEIISSHELENSEKTILPASDYDDVQKMREVIFSDPLMSEMLTGGYSEHSLIGELDGVGVKTRPDLITSAGGIVQYKTTLSCHPVEFGRKIDGYGYLLKAALEWDCFTECYGTEPKYYIFLAQEKKEPFVWKPFNLTPEALQIGRTQLYQAIKMYKHCLETDSWFGYGSDVDDLQLPEWLLRQYDLGK